MSYRSFYRYIYDENGKYYIRKGGELYLICNTLAEALYERDRFENVGWNWDNYVQLVDTNNAYIHIDLPPFEHKARYITVRKERWMVRGKGSRRKYFGSYDNYDEAVKVARIYNANISHISKAYVVKKKINGSSKEYGSFKTIEEAKERVRELETNGWEK